MYSARENAEAYEPLAFRRGHGWTIGGWFVPIGCFWIPYQCMADIWCASDAARPARWSVDGSRPSQLVGAWWIVWWAGLVGNVVSNAQFDDGQSVGAVRGAAITDLVGGVFIITAGALLVIIIIKVHDFLQARFDAAYRAPTAASVPA